MEAAQTVSRPRPDRGITAESVARVDVQAGRRMVDRFGLHAPIQAQFIGHSRQVAPGLGHRYSRLSISFELPGTPHIHALTAGHHRKKLALGLERLPVHLVELRFGIEGVDLLDGTPVLDIKPYVCDFDDQADVRCGWLDEIKGREATADDRFER